MSGLRVAVIGAGASGIGVARTLRRAGVDFEIIEATSRMGGNWQPDGPSSKMYETAHLISSKRNTQFADYPMPKEYPAYPRHDRFYAYLNDLAQASDLRSSIRFDSVVTEMRPDGSGWRLVFEAGDDARYDFVVVCNGLLGRPILPRLVSKASCESFHAVNHKSSANLRGKRVLVVGGGNSGCDIAVDAAHTAAAVFHSTRRGYYYMPKFIDGRPTQEWLMDESPKFADPASYWDHVERTFKMAGFNGVDYGLPVPDHPIHACHPIMNSQVLYHVGHGDIVAKPDVLDVRGDVVTFADGSAEQMDTIIWATGYEVHLPFLATSVFDWRRELSSNFLRMVPERFDNLLFVGYLNSPSGIGNLVNTMARFATNYILAKERDSDEWRTVRRIAKSNSGLDLGEARFMKTARHEFEVDLWKFLRAANFITAKLQAGEPRAEKSHEAIQYA
ncbi:MAG: NAD(P)-binding domain-containing protein [Hyphomicrobium sp.]|jgi:hypothetical protein